MSNWINDHKRMLYRLQKWGYNATMSKFEREGWSSERNRYTEGITLYKEGVGIRIILREYNPFIVRGEKCNVKIITYRYYDPRSGAHNSYSRTSYLWSN